MTRLPKEAQGIAAELARTKAALASAQETINWQRAEIDRLIDQLKDTTRRPVPSKRPLRGKLCGWCDQRLEAAARGHCARMWDTLPSGTQLPECFWVRAIREHGPHGALALSAERIRARCALLDAPEKGVAE